MRVPVFARGSNPAIDRPIVRKSVFYAFEQVENFLADWIDPDDHRKGIIAREFLPSAKQYAVEPEDISTLQHVPGIRYLPAKMAKNPTLARLQFDSQALRLLRKEKLLLMRRKTAEQATA
jgi:hypothetical protein